MGLTNDDIKSLAAQIDGISKVEGSYSFDPLIDGEVVKR